MDPKLREVSQIFERFKAVFSRNDFGTCTTLLSQLKVLLTEFKSLPPLFQETPNAIHELTIARDIYEHAVVLSVKMEDQDAFERDFFQLKSYYTDARGRLPPSPQEYPILGLNLLRLLVQNRIAEFHTELELLSQSALDNPCIKHAVELEQSFMEGAYHRVLSARQTVPDATYAYFMDLLAKTVRDEIAGCSEKAYDRLSTSDAQQMLLFSSDQELLEYVREEHPDWEIKDGFIVFQKDLKNLRKQLYSAAEYFESSYGENEQKHSAEAQPAVSRPRQRHKEHNLSPQVDLQLPKQGDCFPHPFQALPSKPHPSKPKYMKRHSKISRTDSSPNPLNFSFTRVASTKDVRKRSVSPLKFALKRSGSVNRSVSPLMRFGSVISRSISPSTSNKKVRCPSEPRRAVSLSINPERNDAKDIQDYSRKSKNVLTAFLSLHSHGSRKGIIPSRYRDDRDEIRK